jgi:hypothetical protein
VQAQAPHPDAVGTGVVADHLLSSGKLCES